MRRMSYQTCDILTGVGILFTFESGYSLFLMSLGILTVVAGPELSRQVLPSPTCPSKKSSSLRAYTKQPPIQHH